jgi:hypothetical protein
VACNVADPVAAMVMKYGCEARLALGVFHLNGECGFASGVRSPREYNRICGTARESHIVWQAPGTHRPNERRCSASRDDRLVVDEAHHSAW